MAIGLDALLPTLPFSNPWSYWLFYLWTSWGLAWLGHRAVAAWRPDLASPDWDWVRLLGVALVLWPFVKHAYGVYVSFELVLDPNSVAEATPAWLWWLTIQRRAWQYVLLPLAGMFLALGLHGTSPPRPHLRHRVRTTLVAVQIWPRTRWLNDWMSGLALFVAAYFLYYLTAVALAPLRRFDTGDESAVFDALTPGLAFALAITAGVTEELIFRGILQTRLRLIMPTWLAIAIQSIFFGLIHSGYGTLGHIVLPALFGVGMGLVTLRFGLVPAIIIHALVDLVIFLEIAASNGYGWPRVLIPYVFLAGILLPAAFYATEWWNRQKMGRSEVRNP